MSTIVSRAPYLRRWANLSSRRLYSSTQQPQQLPHQKQPSPHAQFYRELIPGMIPVALLGSAVYMALKLVQTNLLHEKFLDESQEKVSQLEAELERLSSQQTTTARVATPPPTAAKRGWLW